MHDGEAKDIFKKDILNKSVKEKMSLQFEQQ